MNKDNATLTRYIGRITTAANAMLTHQHRLANALEQAGEAGSQPFTEFFPPNNKALEPYVYSKCSRRLEGRIGFKLEGLRSEIS